MANRRLRKELLETARGLHAAGAIDFKKLEEFETFRVVQAPAPFVQASAPTASSQLCCNREKASSGIGQPTRTARAT
jgi:hypothetical protein